MRAVDIIAAKRDGTELASEDIEALLKQFVDGTVPDYQMSAFAMAVLLNGMSAVETAALTRGMLYGSVQLTFNTEGPVIDKHSTGGVGDKVSLILAPLLAAAGATIPMISGRGLGLTGGTLDKLESIHGFNTSLSVTQMHDSIASCGCFISGATPDIAPADHQLYLLRDATATVPSVPLITASILSKKLVEGLDHLVLDVKCGSGAHCKSIAEARTLAQSLVDTAAVLGLPCNAVISNMDHPLGTSIGNSLEVLESIEVLKGVTSCNVRRLVLKLAGTINEAVHFTTTEFEQLIEDGNALKSFEHLVETQGGDLNNIHVAPAITVYAPAAGYISGIDANQLARIIPAIGGARATADDKIDHTVGIRLIALIGDKVEKGQPIAELHNHDATVELTSKVAAAFNITSSPLDAPPPIVFETIVPA
ncbi:MAG: thymidine phosphorylase [Pirellulaceae bacterium]